MVRTAIQLYTLRGFDVPFVDVLGRVADAEFTIDPMCLTDPEPDSVVDRIRANLGDEGGA
jgi:hypothetical protein